MGRFTSTKSKRMKILNWELADYWKITSESQTNDRAKVGGRDLSPAGEREREQSLDEEDLKSE